MFSAVSYLNYFFDGIHVWTVNIRAVQIFMQPQFQIVKANFQTPYSYIILL